jgi:hypothetical protein
MPLPVTSTLARAAVVVVARGVAAAAAALRFASVTPARAARATRSEVALGRAEKSPPRSPPPASGASGARVTRKGPKTSRAPFWSTSTRR